LDGSKRHFDLVVFDEASQILQEETVPALYRAEQVVVAGDRHQLPPTTFFATAIEGEDQIGEEDEEMRGL
jgi:superfamily I DNA and/or RNA helicase